MKRPKFIVYKATDGFRWRLVAANGRIVADSGEAYTRPQDAHRAVRTVKRIVKTMNRVVLPIVDPKNLSHLGANIGYAIG